jgi:hypothetical protein
LALFGLYPAGADEVIEARAFAAGLIGGEIVTPEALQMVHERTGAGLFVYRYDGVLSGVIALVLLTDEGLRAAMSDAFDALAPNPAHVARFDQDPAGVYGWGIAAADKAAARRLAEASGAMTSNSIGHLPHFARAATEAGARFMERLGFRPYPGSRKGLVLLDPQRVRMAAA